ncbi:molybdopterin-guanine dinucleotide biosynthesis protein B [Xylophilus sp.]|uniref:molybdopterin-guanine dinucleotide biosynthesis protein B n=1 Tax=Xylophilus sp. TaxID=2653893 RepID=UPI0013B894C9|nr:molybdopterin-guanine dinucleotide biosynthesis protein B [Xylophilus sp.]KAF1045835.1 MAG: Molybdopterin-guanine dinucleotide biosynthesis adapter protein [Xylophilus sp.]
MKVAIFAGWSGSGKTTLVERVIPALKARGQRVSVIKHAHHNFDVDKPGKDTWRHREAGAFEVIGVSDRRFALMQEFEQPITSDEGPDLAALIARLDARADWVLVEGFKQSPVPKIEVWRAVPDGEPARPLRFAGDAAVLAIATDAPQRLPAGAPPALDINRPEAVAQWLLDHADRFEWQGSL